MQIQLIELVVETQVMNDPDALAEMIKVETNPDRISIMSYRFAQLREQPQ